MPAIAKVAHVTNNDIALRVHLGKQTRYLARLGYEVHGIVPRGKWITTEGLTEDGIRVKFANYSSSPRTPIRDTRALVTLVRYFRAQRFDIVHTHGLKPGLIGRLAARIARVPIVVHTIHGLFMYERMSPVAKRLWTEVERLGMKLGDYALSQNRDDVDGAIAAGLCRPDRIGYLGNGIDLEVFNPAAVDRQAVNDLRREWGAQPGDTVVSIAGRLIVEKGHIEFLEAAREIRARRPDVHFWVAGAEQPERPGRLHGTVAASEVVRFLGMRWDMPVVMAASDVFVLPSHGREGIPRVLMEAAALERPIVTTDVRGCRDVVQHEVTGLLVPPSNGPELARALLRLIDNPAEASILGANAGRFARQHFDENVYCERIARCYESLLRSELPGVLDLPMGAGARG